MRRRRDSSFIQLAWIIESNYQSRRDGNLVAHTCAIFRSPIGTAVWYNIDALYPIFNIVDRYLPHRYVPIPPIFNFPIFQFSNLFKFLIFQKTTPNLWQLNNSTLMVKTRRWKPFPTLHSFGCFVTTLVSQEQNTDAAWPSAEHAPCILMARQYVRAPCLSRR